MTAPHSTFMRQFRLLLIGLAWGLPEIGGWSAQPVLPLQTAAQIRQLSPANAAKGLPIHLHALVTYLDESNFYRFVQDATAGIYFNLAPGLSLSNLGVRPGMWVVMDGTTSPGEYAPVVLASRIAVIGPGPWPVPRSVTFQEIASGSEDSQFVSVQGIVRSAGWDSAHGEFILHLATGGGRLTVILNQPSGLNPSSLVDATVRVSGVCAGQFNLQRQLFDTRLLAPRSSDLSVENPAPADPFSMAPCPIEQLLRFAPGGTYGHRVKIIGTVIARNGDDALYVEDATEGLFVETDQAGSLQPGDQVQVLGFPAQGVYTPMLQDGSFRKITAGKPPLPDKVTADQALSGTHDCRLVRLEATVVDHSHTSQGESLLLQSSGFIFNAGMPKNQGQGLAGIENGSRVAVTGVCLIDPGQDWHAGSDWRAKSFRLLLRSPSDVTILKNPPWWTLARVVWATACLGLIVLSALAWVGILRRRVHHQTAIIRRQLATEGAMKERYENLFENARDMVFTHDPKGRITSVNKTGELFLHRPRTQILGRNLSSFIKDDQRDALRDWLDQVSQGIEPATTEWDLPNPDGSLRRVEISALLIKESLFPPEIESVARDITGRKQMERELLEISNREQQRIGHDLHDGVCQQLAAIAYRLDMLSDQLQEKNLQEAGEAEHIRGLLNEAMVQTRSVARGLFPVRLEEGLAFALEELAGHAELRFRLQCQFSCDHPSPTLPPGTAIHLYYIAHEALTNASRHGSATRASITISRQQDRWILSVQDNGRGFNPHENPSGGMGIRIMRHRAQVIAAILDLKSAPGQGTQVSCSFRTTT